MNFPYAVKPAHTSAKVLIAAQLGVKDHEGTIRQELATRLVAMLNAKKMDAPVMDTAQGNRVALTFKASERQYSPSCLYVEFLLNSADNAEIQRVAEVAQKFLTDEISNAILAFMAMLAVTGCDPFQAAVNNAVRAYRKRSGN